MRRGDVVTVGVTGDYGKPRPAVVVQSDALPESYASVVICPMTSDLTDAPDVRILIEPSPSNRLRLPSQIMADKPVTVRRERIGPVIGRLEAEDLRRLTAALALVLGFAD